MANPLLSHDARASEWSKDASPCYTIDPFCPRPPGSLQARKSISTFACAQRTLFVPTVEWRQPPLPPRPRYDRQWCDAMRYKTKQNKAKRSEIGLEGKPIATRNEWFPSFFGTPKNFCSIRTGTGTGTGTLPGGWVGGSLWSALFSVVVVVVFAFCASVCTCTGIVHSKWTKNQKDGLVSKRTTKPSGMQMIGDWKLQDLPRIFCFAIRNRERFDTFLSHCIYYYIIIIIYIMIRLLQLYTHTLDGPLKSVGFI